MYYFITKGSTPLGYTEESFICGAVEANEKGKIVFYSLGQILTDTKLQSKLDFNKHVAVKYDLFSETNGTNFVVPSVAKNLSSNDYDDYLIALEDEFSLQNLCLNDDEERMLVLLQLLADNIEEFADIKSSIEEFKIFLKESQTVLVSIAANTFYYNIVAEHTYALEELNDYNANTNGEFVNYTVERESANVSLIMKSCDSELNLAIPEYDYLNTSNSEMYDYLHQKFFNDVFMLETYIRPFNMPANNIDAENYLRHYDKDSGEIVNGILDDFPKKYIFGTEDNNYLGLQDNEEKFYNRLNEIIDELMPECVSTYNKGVNTDSQVSIETFKKACLIDSKMQLKVILDAFIYLALNINWRFKSYVPLEMFNAIDNDFDSDADSNSDFASEGAAETVTGIHTFSIDPNNEAESQTLTAMDVIETIDKFVTTNKCSVYAYSEIIVKLLRWGDRKPNKLILNFEKSKGFSIATESLDLATLRVNYDETLNKVEVTDTPNLVGVIYSSREDLTVNRSPEIENLAGKNGIQLIDDLIRVPFGVILSQTMKVKTNDVEEVQNRYIFVDSYTLIKRFVKGNLKVNGITLEDNKFKVDEDYLIDVNVENKTYDDEGNLITDTVTMKVEKVVKDVVDIAGNYDTRKVTRYYYNNDYLNLFKLLNEKGVKGIPELPTKEQLNSCNICEVLNEMVVYNEVNLGGLLRDTETAMVHIFVAKTLFNYFKKCFDMSVDTGESISLEDSLNLFADSLGVFKIKEEKPATADSTTTTSLFENKETYKMVLRINHLWLFVTNDNELVVRNPEGIDVNSIPKKASQHLATKNVCIFLLKPDLGIKISDETRQHILSEFKNIYKSDDIRLIYKFTAQQTQGGK
jgi:hypothetical protein